MAAGAAFRLELLAGANVAEVALVDREGLGERHPDASDVCVSRARPEIEPQTRVSAPRRRLPPTQLANGHPRLERQGRAIDGLEPRAEVGNGALIAYPLRIDRVFVAV